MSEGTIANRHDYDVGLTLDVSLKPCASPFSDDSLIQFSKAFQAKDQSNPSSQGTFKSVQTLAQSQATKAKALDIEGSLDFSYGPVSGDANVKFAMKNVQSSLDLTMVISAKHSGRLVKNSMDEMVRLKLRPTVLEQINSGALSFEQFKQQYGEYLIIGYEYGGHVLFKSIYSTKSSEDKLSVAGGLSLSYGKMGFNISGSVQGQYKSEDISKSTDIKTDYTIAPSFNDKLINGAQGIIPLLKQISNPMQNGIDLDASDADKYGNLAQEVDRKIQQLLSSKKLDAINCIVLNIKTIGCVKDAFVEQVQKVRDIQIFFKFANPLYMTMKEMLKGLDVVNDKYDELQLGHKPYGTINAWFESLDHVIQVMETVHTTRIYKYAKMYVEALHNKRKVGNDDDDEKEEREIDKVFYAMNLRLLKNQFREQVLKPYNNAINRKNKAPKPVQQQPIKQKSKKPYVWQWQNESGIWVNYDALLQSSLRQLIIGNNVTITVGKWDYVITKKAADVCSQQNKQTGTSRVVRRVSDDPHANNNSNNNNNNNNNASNNNNRARCIFLWQFMDQNNKWNDVSSYVSSQLNTLAVNGSTQYNVGSYTYNVRKTSMDKCSQKNNQTGGQRQLRRILFDNAAQQRVMWQFEDSSNNWIAADSTDLMQQLSRLAIGSQMNYTRSSYAYVITKDDATHATQRNTNTGRKRKFRMITLHKDT